MFTPMILIKSSDKQLIMPALTNLVGRYSKDIPFQLTGLLLASINPNEFRKQYWKNCIDEADNEDR